MVLSLPARNCELGHRVRNMRHMRVVVTRYDGPEVITAIEEDVPTPAAGEYG